MSEDPAGAIVEGTAVFRESGLPCRLDYRVTCDAEWRTIAARVTGWLDWTEIDVEVIVDAARIWTFNGQPCPDVQGCDDIDLSFTPATNLLPIRRTRPGIGTRIAVRAAWLRVPSFSFELLEQVYHRIDATTYRYESAGGRFTAELKVNATGFVTRYADIWEQEAG